jgi:hypothetical protein
LGVPEILSALPAAALFVLPALGAAALATLAYAWRADAYLHRCLMPLTDRIAATQLTLLTEAA